MDCQVDSCGRQVFSAGYCRTHHRWWKAGKDLSAPVRISKHAGECTINGCTTLIKAKGFCPLHYSRWKNSKDLVKVASPKRNGDRYLGPGGYIMIRVDGRARYEHRVVMEVILGRKLVKGENVHHLNGNRMDNRKENLELWNTSQPAGQRVKDKVIWAKEILVLYDGKVFQG